MLDNAEPKDLLQKVVSETDKSPPTAASRLLLRQLGGEASDAEVTDLRSHRS